jgi:hypothetical protein
MKNILNKGTLVMCLLFLVTLAIMITDPLNLNPEGFKGTTVLPVLYLLPALIYWFFYFVKPTLFGTKNYSENQKRDLLYLQIISILRKVLAVFAAFILAGISSKIPYFDLVNDVITYIASNFDTSVQAIELIIGLILGLIAQFSKNSRFEDRIEVEPRKIQL